MEGALLTRPMGVRRRGQTDAGSWAAHMFARICGTVVVGLVISGLIVPAGATASSPDPSPQKAPTSSGTSQPAPDPSPQATSTRPETHQSTATKPAIRVPVVVTPTRRVVVTPTQPVSSPAAVSTSAASTPAPTPARPRTPHPRVDRTPTAHRTVPTTTTFSFPLALPRDLLLLPATALHAGESGHRDGALLLLTSVAMAGLAVASFTLLRRLRRLEPR